MGKGHLRHRTVKEYLALWDRNRSWKPRKEEERKSQGQALFAHHHNVTLVSDFTLPALAFFLQILEMNASIAAN